MDFYKTFLAMEITKALVILVALQTGLRLIKTLLLMVIIREMMMKTTTTKTKTEYLQAAV